MKFSISILAHHGLAMTQNCLRAVAEGGGDYELLLTNNGSGEHMRYHMMHAIMGSTKGVVFDEPKNLGFIEPNIRALEHARGDYFVLLNSDTCVPPGWLEALEAPFLSDPLCAISGATGMALSAGFVGYNGGKNVEYIEGSCLMIRTEFARKIGLFDTQLIGAYGEDADLCLRVRSIGHTIHVVPIDIKHLGGATSSMVPQAHSWLTQNLSYLKTKWANYLKNRTFNAPPDSPH